jgi:hypothetical protein
MGNRGEKRMKIILALLLLLTATFASITPTELPTTVLYGGETQTYTITIHNDFSYDVNVHLEGTLETESGTTDGITTTISQPNFQLKAYQNKDVNLVITTVPSLMPDTIYLGLQATYTLDGNQVPIRIETITKKSNGGGSSGGSTVTIYKDKNVPVITTITKEVPVEKIVEKPIEVIKEIEKVVNTTTESGFPLWVIIASIIAIIVLSFSIGYALFIINEKRGT